MSLPEKYLYLKFFWSVFPRIRTVNGESISPYRKIRTRKNSKYRHFPRSVWYLQSYSTIIVHKTLYSEVLLPGHNITTTILLSPLLNISALPYWKVISQPNISVCHSNTNVVKNMKEKRKRQEDELNL